MHVFTGDVSSAGTNSNVFICLYGELGDTGERKLEKSETHMDKFERNNVRIAFFLTYIQKMDCCIVEIAFAVLEKSTRMLSCI